MDPEITEGILQEIDPKIKEMSEQGLTPLLITTSELRLAFRRFMEPSYPHLVILSYQELPTETKLNHMERLFFLSNLYRRRFCKQWMKTRN